MTDYNDGKWHRWNGGECPVHPKSVVGAVWHDDNLNQVGIRVDCAGGGAWHNQILKFRVIKEHREPREWWLVKNGSSSWAFNSAREAKTAYPGCTPIHVTEITE